MFDSRALKTAKPATVGEGNLVYSVGDIHGSCDLLQQLLGMIADDAAKVAAARRTLIFIGDYIDRGPDSRGVIDTLLTGLPKGFAGRFLKGNHEQLLLNAIDDAAEMPLWLANGGATLLKSYGIEVERFEGQPLWKLRDALEQAMPAKHRKFLRDLELHIAMAGYVFVHAGLRPHVPLERQSEADRLWIRDEFLLSDFDFGPVVVHGHTPVDRPEVRSNRIDIDTYAWSTGHLTALRLYGSQRSFIAT